MGQVIAIFLAIVFGFGLPQTARAGGHYYGGGSHTSSHGGTYVGGSGSSHAGGHYVGPYGGYGRHK